MSKDGREGRPAPPTQQVPCPLCANTPEPGLLRYSYRHALILHSVPLCPKFQSMKPEELFGALVMGAARARTPRDGGPS